MSLIHQRPNKLPLPSAFANATGKPILERKVLPCAKGSLSPNPHPWQNKRHKITSPNAGCAPKSSLIYDAVSAHLKRFIRFYKKVTAVGRRCTF